MGKARTQKPRKRGAVMNGTLQKLKRKSRWKAQKNEYLQKHARVHEEIKKRSELRRKRASNKSLITKQTKANKVLGVIIDAIRTLSDSRGSSKASIAAYLNSQSGRESNPTGKLAVTPVQLSRALIKGTKMNILKVIDSEDGRTSRYQCVTVGETCDKIDMNVDETEKFACSGEEDGFEADTSTIEEELPDI